MIVSYLVYINFFVECKNRGHFDLWKQLKVPLKKKKKIKSPTVKKANSEEEFPIIFTDDEVLVDSMM